MTQVSIITIDKDCLHCILHAGIKIFLEVNPDKDRNEVLSALIQVTAEFLTFSSQSEAEFKQATEAFIAQIPDAMLRALDALPTANPGRPS